MKGEGRQLKGSGGDELDTVAGGGRVEVDVVAGVVRAVRGEDGELTAVDQEPDRERAIGCRQRQAVEQSGSDVVDDVTSGRSVGAGPEPEGEVCQWAQARSKVASSS